MTHAEGVLRKGPSFHFTSLRAPVSRTTLFCRQHLFGSRSYILHTHRWPAESVLLRAAVVLHLYSRLFYAVTR